MALESTLRMLKATADVSRLRLLALLAGGEATVGELVAVVGQSQPRVSRHLRILGEAGLLTHFRDGQCVYYRLARGSGPELGLAEAVLALARNADAVVAEDTSRMAAIRRGRERVAYQASSGPRLWAAPTGDRPREDDLARALDEALGPGQIGDVLDVGSGAGALLRLLAPRARNAVGLDCSRGMRVLARSRLQEAGLAQCTIRAGDMHALPFPDLSFDVVLLDEVLSLSDQPQRVIAEALRVLRPAGRLLILDRIRPTALRLTSQAGRRALFANQLTVMLRGLGLKAGRPAWFPGRAPEYALVAARTAAQTPRTGTDE